MVVIIDYGLGNLFSVAKAFEMIGAEVLVSKNPKDLARADHIVLPGVGAFADGINYLKDKGFISELAEQVLKNKKPFLGICLGMQLLAEKGFEYGEHKGLGWLKGEVKKLDVEKLGLKVPHIGWNSLAIKKDSQMFFGIKPNSDFYFVHSYALHCTDASDVVATTFYGEEITSAVIHENIWAVQFHPEKSQEAGLKLLENFIKYA